MNMLLNNLHNFGATLAYVCIYATPILAIFVCIGVIFAEIVANISHKHKKKQIKHFD